MARRSRRKFSDEQKADAVRMVREIGNVAKAARDLDLTETTLRNWMKRADIDEGRGPDGALNSDECKELQRLKRENHVLQQERAFLRNRSRLHSSLGYRTPIEVDNEHQQRQSA